jgi:putative intracellular protease/amidase
MKFWRLHGTKLIGFAQGTVAALCGVAGIIPDAHLKYWLAASALLTFWRGFFNDLVNKAK